MTTVQFAATDGTTLVGSDSAANAHAPPDVGGSDPDDEAPLHVKYSAREPPDT